MAKALRAKTLSVRVTPYTRQLARVLRDEKGMSISSLIGEALEAVATMDQKKRAAVETLAEDDDTCRISARLAKRYSVDVLRAATSIKEAE